MNIKHLIPRSAMALAALLGASTSGLAQSILQTAGNFTLLGGTAITSTGVTGTNIVTGNVGLSPGATSLITGFPPAVITGGGALVPTGAVTGQARLDLITASVALANLPSNVNMSNVDLGGTTLAPGVYTFNGAASLNGALVLDAQGKNNVSWVFQIGTSLTTSVNSTVTIINPGSNGGSDLGVFWNAGSAITIGGNNQIAGNYLSGTSITFGSLSAGGGRALALAGISLDDNVINSAGGPAGSGLAGGLTFNANGTAVPATAAVAGGIIVPGGTVSPAGVVVSGGTLVPGATTGSSGSVVIGPNGVYTPGISTLPMTPGIAAYATTLGLDGNIADGTAAAALRINAATVTLTGTNTYSGGTAVDRGALVTGSANLPANQPVSLTGGSQLIFNQTAAGTFGGVVSGSGSVTKLGAGALTVTGANTYTGGTAVNAGSLVASTSTLPAGQAVSVASGATLVFNQTGDGVFSGHITGAGTLQKTGASKLTLTNLTTTAVSLQSGSLYFNGGLGTTTVASGAFLGGKGTIAGNLVNNGTVSPGFSPGTISVTGNYTQSSTGTLVIQIASGTSFDKLAVAGTATLAGTLQVDILGAFNPVGQSFTFLTATGGVSGQFGSLTGNTAIINNPTLAAAVTYASNSVSFAIVQKSFASFGLTPNQRAVAAAAQAAPALNATIIALPNAAALPVAFNALSPQGYEIWSDLAFARATALSDRLTRDNGAVPDHDSFYFDGSQRRARARADLDLGSSTYTSTSGLVGLDHAMTTGMTTGIFFSYGKSVAGLGQPGGSTDETNKLVGLRAAWTQDHWFANGTYSYGWDRYSSVRPVVFPGTSAVATSSTSGHEWFVDLSAGRHFTKDDLTLSPFAGLLVSGWNADGFTETGAGIFNNQVDRQAARSLRSELGVDGRINWKVGGIGVQPHLRVAFLHEFSDEARGINAMFDSVAYSVATRGAPSNSALFNIGLNAVLNPRALVYAEYTAQTGNVIKYLSDWRVGVSVRF